MIIVRIIGGLGNQMFQYAAARALALETGLEVKIDTTWYDEKRFAGDSPREFGLDAFDVKLPKATKEEVTALKGLSYQARKYAAKVRRRLVGENFGFDPAFFATPDGTYLEGYWQSAAYFEKHAAVIREDFQLSRGFGTIGEALADEIGSGEDAVSIHVRRGDYVSNSKVSRTYGVLGQEYYAAAAARVAKEVPGPRFFVFSDDIDWVRDNLRVGEAARFVSGSSLTPQEEVLLMSRCRNHVIANSSFGWWGAWLDASPEKLVIAPRKWFVSWRLRHRRTVPDNWIRL